MSNIKKELYEKIYLLLLIHLILLSCSKNDLLENQILGEWKLIEERIISETNPDPNTIDYSNKNIIYNFKSNGKLVVTGGQNVEYPNGEYDYFFGEDYLSGFPSENERKTLLVKIDNSKWTFNLTNGVIKLGQS